MKSNTKSFCLAFIIASNVLLLGAFIIHRVHGSYLTHPKIYNNLRIAPMDPGGYMFSWNGDNLLSIVKDSDSFVARIVKGNKALVTYRFGSNDELSVFGDNWEYASQVGKVEVGGKLAQQEVK